MLKLESFLSMIYNTCINQSLVIVLICFNTCTSISSSLDELVLDPVPLELSSSLVLSSFEEPTESLNREDLRSLEPLASP